MKRLVNYLFFLDSDLELEKVVPIKNIPELYLEEEYIESIFRNLLKTSSVIKASLQNQKKNSGLEYLEVETSLGSLTMEINPLLFSQDAENFTLISFVDGKGKNEINPGQQLFEKQEMIDKLDEFSHEIKNAVNVIYGISEYMSSSNQEEILDLLPTLNTSTKHLKGLVSSYLQNRKFENQRWNRDEFNVEEEIQEIVNQHTVLKNSETKKISYWIDPRITGSVIGYPLAIRQVLLNLLGNALEHTEQVDVTLGVSLMSDNSDEILLNYSVKDNGGGIPKDIMEGLFKRGKSSKLKKDGFGLGLNISKKILNSLNSDLILKSELGRGTCFSFDINLQKSVSNSFSKRELKAASPSTRIHFKGKKVLIVDDDHVNRLIAAKNLTRFGLNCKTVSNGVFGIQKLYEEHFDLIFLDIHLPILDGLSLFYLIKKRFPELKVVVCSGSINQNMRSTLKKQGVCSFLNKPYDNEELGEILSFELL